MKREDMLRVMENFTKENEFRLNPDEKHVGFILDGLLTNEKEFGLKLCPCRLRDGTLKRDLELLCPCNFKTHDTWKKEGRCWCGLFVKR